MRTIYRLTYDNPYAALDLDPVVPRSELLFVAADDQDAIRQVQDFTQEGSLNDDLRNLQLHRLVIGNLHEAPDETLIWESAGRLV